jgi:hypothetical protein
MSDGAWPPWWPTRQQEFLLRAALLEGARALDAWQHWQAEADLDAIDAESQRLLPLVCRKLLALGVEDPALGRLKGIYRQVWYKNHLLLGRVAEPLRALDKAGIDVMILKGYALLVGYYRDFGTRAMADIDVLVPVGRAWDAIEILEQRGWAPLLYNDRRAITHAYIETEHSVGFRHPAGWDFDLHWHVLPESCRPGADDAFWAHSRPIELNGVCVRALDATDQLLHVLAHGIKWEGGPKLRWATDAAVILGAAEQDVDWDRLQRRTCDLRLVQPVRDALCYLQHHLEAPIPAEVAHAFEAMPVTRADRLEYRLRTTPQDLTLLNVLLRLWFWHRRLADFPAAGRLLWTFPRFVQRYYELPSLWRVPRHAATRALARVRRAGLGWSRSRAEP